MRRGSLRSSLSHCKFPHLKNGEIHFSHRWEQARLISLKYPICWRERGGERGRETEGRRKKKKKTNKGEPNKTVLLSWNNLFPLQWWYVVRVCVCVCGSDGSEIWTDRLPLLEDAEKEREKHYTFLEERKRKARRESRHETADVGWSCKSSGLIQKIRSCVFHIQHQWFFLKKFLISAYVTWYKIR